MPYTLADYERDAERFCQTAGQERLRYLLGQSPDPLPRRLFNDWGFLFGTDLIEQLGQEPIEPARRRSLVAFAVQGYLMREGQALLSKIAAYDAQSSVLCEGDQIRFRSVPARLANLSDMLRRHRLDEARRSVVATIAAERWALHETWLAACTELGRSNLMTLWDELVGLRLESLVQLANSFLDETDGLYRDALATALRLAGLERGDAWSGDLGWLTRGAEFDLAFEPRSLVPVMRQSLLRLGLRMEEQPGIVLHPDSRPEKASESTCVSLSVPYEVHAVLAPVGGWQDYAHLLALLGQAEHLANVDPALVMPYRWLGDPAIHLGSGLLLEGLTRDRRWLADNVDLDDAASFGHRAGLAHLMGLRRAAATLSYEARLQGAEPVDWEAVQHLYVEQLSAVLGARHFTEDALVGIEEPFQAAHSLRAALFAEQLRLYLVREYDEEWFSALRAGKFLVELWREGTRYTAEELLRFMGYDGFDSAPLLGQIRNALGGA